MATTRFADHLLQGDHAARPAAGDVPAGTLYACSDHGLIYQSDGASWSTWATLGATSIAAEDVTVTDSGAFYTATDVEGVLAEIAPQLVTGGLFDAYALLRDEKASTTGGGTLTSGAWRTRDLAEKFDVGGIVSVTANQFDLADGTYFVQAFASAYHTGNHQIRIYNVDDSVTVGVGVNARAPSTDEAQDPSKLSCRFTVSSGPKTFELQHRVTSTSASFGAGVNNDFGEVEVYAEVAIWREA